MAIPENSTVLFNLVFQLQGQKWINSQFMSNDDAISNAQELIELNAVVDYWYAAYDTFLHEDVQLLGAVVSLPEDPVFGTRTVTKANLFGLASGDPGPTTSYVIVRRKALTRDRAWHGKVLVAGFPMEFTEANRLTDNAAAILQIIATAMETNFAGPASNWVNACYSATNDSALSTFKSQMDPVVRSYTGRQASLI